MGKRCTVSFVPEAELEFEQARLWYENCQPGLGSEFVDEIAACLNRIAESPKLYAKVKKDYRQATIRRFPYAIYYEHDDNRIVIYSVFHCSQDPVKLDERLR